MKLTTPALADLASTNFVQLLFTDVAGHLKSVEIPSARWAAVSISGRPLDGSVMLGGQIPTTMGSGSSPTPAALC